MVQTLTDQQLDIVPEFKADQVSETQLIVTQRTLDCEQFVQRRAQKLCFENNLEFLHCEDYDIKLLHVNQFKKAKKTCILKYSFQVCPLNGHIICQAVIKIGTLQLSEAQPKPKVYISNCMFTWNIDSDAFQIIEPPEEYKLQPSELLINVLQVKIPKINTKRAVVMNFNCHSSKSNLRDYNNYFEIFMEEIDNRKLKIN